MYRSLVLVISRSFWAAVVLVAGLSNAYAGPMGTACMEPSNSFPLQVNCGTFLDTVNANDGGGPLIILGVSYGQVAKYEVDGAAWFGTGGFSITGVPGSSGTWASTTAIMFMVVKASDNYTVYGQGNWSGGIAWTTNGTVADGTGTFSGALSGNWATAPELITTSGRDGVNSAGKNLSHLSFYGITTIEPTCEPNCGNPFQPVPEPGLLSLLGLGLLGLGLSRRRQRA